MKTILKSSILLLIMGLVFTSCKKDEETDPETEPDVPQEAAIAPTVATDTAVNIYWDYTARSWGTKGIISDLGGSEILSSGICWSTSKTPTISDSKVEKLSSSTYLVTITGLNDGEDYFIRAYATNAEGTGYGETVAVSSPVADGVEQTVSDVDGNTYKTVTMRGKEWMAENLKTTKLNDGTAIKLETMSWSVSTDPLYTYYDNDKATYENPYGAMYNYYCVETGKLCPVGWHVSTYQEWEDLAYHWGGQSKAGAKLKEKGTAHFRVTQSEVDNQSKLSLIAGGRYESGRFDALTDFAQYWKEGGPEASSKHSVTYILANGKGVSKKPGAKENGYNVRCVKD